MSDTKRLGMPLLVMAVSTLLFYLMNKLLPNSIAYTCITLMCDIALFLFGMALNAKRNSRGVYRKVIALICAIILVFIQLGVVSMPWVETLQTAFSINPYLLSMLFIYFGFLFAD